MINAVIGKNFGDCGKGLCVDFYARSSLLAGKSCAVIKHNGGAQAGHTVDLSETDLSLLSQKPAIVDPKRKALLTRNDNVRTNTARANGIVFHQLSSGTCRGADTIWAPSYYPDLYKLREELASIPSGIKLPRIYAFAETKVTTIYDVLINMALETCRGNQRHGSCGMGINEALLRTEFKVDSEYKGDSEFAISMQEIIGGTAQSLASKLKYIADEYVPLRIRELREENLDITKLKYMDLIFNPNTSLNVAEEMMLASEFVDLTDASRLKKYDDYIFEGAQGLLLDSEYIKFAPHLTSSRTGLTNPLNFIREYLPAKQLSVTYVTRAYVTRHGAGPLPGEDTWPIELKLFDSTNLTNDWQGSIRYAPHAGLDEFWNPLEEDLSKTSKEFSDLNITTNLMITHLNETQGNLLFINERIDAENFLREAINSKRINGGLLSYTPWSKDVFGIAGESGLG